MPETSKKSLTEVFSGNGASNRETKSEIYPDSNKAEGNIQEQGNEENSEPNHRTNEEKEDGKLGNIVSKQCFHAGKNGSTKTKSGNQSKPGNPITCLVTKNQSNTDIILYIYVGWTPLAKVSTFSKIIKAKKSYFYHEKTPFKFKVVAICLKSKTRKKILGPEELKESKEITITELIECHKKNISEIENGMRLCNRKIQREEELVPGDLYDILGLDMEEVRKMNTAEAKEAIRSGSRKQQRIWHPDKNFGDDEIIKQITMARDDLMDDEKRARYHNEKRWEAPFWSHCTTKEKAYWYRIGYGVASCVIAAAGIALFIGTAGAAVPLAISGWIIGTGLTGAGIQSLGYTSSKKAGLDGCDIKSWASNVGIGFLFGAVTGGIAVGTIAGVIGIGSAALEANAVTTGQSVGIGSANSAVGGVMSSLASDFAKTYVDKEKVPARQVALHALLGGGIGLLAGAVGGAVTKAMVDSRASAATSTLEGDAVEQVSPVTAGKRIGHEVAHVTSKQLAIAGTKGVLRIASKVVDERLNDSVENKTVLTHVQNGIKNIVANAAQNTLMYAAGGAIGSAFKELTLDEQSDSRNGASNRETKSEIYPESNKAAGNIQEQGNEESGEPSDRKNEEKEDEEPGNIVSKQCFHAGKNGSTKAKSGNQSNNANDQTTKTDRSHTTIERRIPEADDECHEEHCRSTQQNPQVISEELTVNSSINDESETLVQRGKMNEKDDEEDYIIIKYKSTGKWFSKMIVTYSSDGRKITKEVSGDGKRVFISADATNIEVKFQVRRPVWGDVMKYDRFQKTWCEPYTPHIFKYKKAVDRTFTLSGPLWWEAVMRVSDEYHEETEEME